MRSLFILFLAANTFAQNGADSIALASVANEDSSLLRLTALRVNSTYADYCAAVHGGSLCFVSARPANMGVVYADMNDKTEITDIYSATLKSPTLTSSAKPLEFNSRFYEGPFCFSQRGDTIYFTGNDGKTPQLRIMFSVKNGAKWSKPVTLPFCNDSFAYCHPSLSPEGKLYLSSNQNTGGDMDLFVTSILNGEWKRPLNLGNINTDSNEVFPFAGRAGNIYFSSNRAGGIGKLDIYHMQPGRDETPHLLFPPINSTADDFGIFTDSTGDSGYISSNRKGTRSDDIFYFERSIPDFTRCGEPPVRRRFCYTFYEATTAGAQDTSILYYQWDFGDGTTARGLRTRHCYTATGTYEVQLFVVEKLSGQIDTSLVKYDVEIPEQEQLKIEAEDSGVINELIVFDATSSAVKDHEITNYYWSFGDGFYNRGAISGHRYRKEGKYVVELWVTARPRQGGAEQKYRTTRLVTVRAIN